jgi:hypothetical protein
VLANIDADFEWHLRVYCPSSIEHRTLRFSEVPLVYQACWRSLLENNAIATPELPEISVSSARCKAHERASFVIAPPELRIEPCSSSLEDTQQRVAVEVERKLSDALSTASIDRARTS